MVRLLMVMGMLGLAWPVHAADISATFAQWQTLRDPDKSSIRFMDGASFLYEHSGWPEEKTIRLRTEAAALFERPSREVITKFCKDFPPISGRGMVACANGGAADSAQQRAWLKEGWTQGDFNEAEEQNILRTYGDSLSKADHRARVDRLLHEGKTAAAKRVVHLAPADYQKIYAVRVALIAGDKKAPALLKTLSSAQQREAGVLFDRARWQLRRGDSNYAELVAAVPADTPHADAWWPMRQRAVRDALSKRSYSRAYTLIKHHGELKDNEDMAEALWLKGWLQLRHRGDAGSAYKQFFKLYTTTSTPVSKARAAYWAGRAAEKNGNKDIARDWMKKAAERPTVFYGQLAQAWLKPKSSLDLPKPPRASDKEEKQFEADPLVRTAKMIDYNGGDERLRDRFMAAAAKRLSDGQLSLLAEFGKKMGGTTTGVEIAKLALRNGVALIPHGWPRTKLPDNLPIEPALTLAITRQESQFDPTARSSANAQGLMQLLPSTANQVARGLGIKFKREMLNDPQTNLTLGSRYLRQVISGFDGSYILGVASYNAGPGNVRSWIKTMGKPPKKLEGAIDWIESIPFTETRNYVMRVHENLGVYRTLLDENAPLMIEKDLVR